ncbi:hypothetical protein TRVA0_009S01706 [Trichomonascus vanleenenianus]|uniref:uncharacterized protein n=1 Tax=Trichomonascus vanleenenianus TaxID=2268995 RepID=UPI003EC9C915
MAEKKKQTRSRSGCHRCKQLKIKCDEQKPACGRCTRLSMRCDYSIKLTWGGRPFKDASSKAAKGGSMFSKGFVAFSVDPGSTQVETLPTNPPASNNVTTPSTADPRSSIESPSIVHTHTIDTSTINDTTPEDLLELQLVPTSVNPVSFGPTDMVPYGSANPASYGPLYHDLQTLSEMSPEDFFNDELKRAEISYEFFEKLPIPRSIAPLPDALLQNPYYQELFHYFTNYLARLLAPIPGENPFRTVLPGMALETPHLMKLLLAFSASHKAKVTNSSEPVEMIADLLASSLKGLSQSLEDQTKAIVDSTLASVLLFTSYEVLHSPSSTSQWRAHLLGARQIVNERGLSRRLMDESFKTAGGRPFFLARIFAYIDTISSLCASSIASRQIEWSDAEHESSSSESALWNNTIDNFLALDLKMIPVFNKVVDLIQQTSQARFVDNHVMEEALGYESKLLAAAPVTSDEFERWITYCSMPTAEALNAAYCYAVLIQLYRRVMKYPMEDPKVQEAANVIAVLLETNVPIGSETEASISFPIFIAGCEIIDPSKRELFRQRMKGMSRFGMGHLCFAYEVMEKSWATNKPWYEIMKESGKEIVLL